MDVPRTSLSAGILIRKVLLECEAVTDITTNIFPVEIPSAKCPYIYYRRCARDVLPVKGAQSSNTVQIQVDCCHELYDGSLELAEAVCFALDNAQATEGNLTMRSCILTDSEEDYTGDAYVQHLMFNVKIS